MKIIIQRLRRFKYFFIDIVISFIIYVIFCFIIRIIHLWKLNWGKSEDVLVGHNMFGHLNWIQNNFLLVERIIIIWKDTLLLSNHILRANFKLYTMGKFFDFLARKYRKPSQKWASTYNEYQSVGFSYWKVLLYWIYTKKGNKIKCMLNQVVGCFLYPHHKMGKYQGGENFIGILSKERKEEKIHDE